MAAAEEREEPKDVGQEGDHRAAIYSESKLTDQPLALWIEVWRSITY
jgi:hypothetical protein